MVRTDINLSPLRIAVWLTLSRIGFWKTKPPAKVQSPVGLKLILGMQFDEAIDIWSFGCVTFELFTHFRLFNLTAEEPENIDDEHLLNMIAILGGFPDSFYKVWPRWDRYLDKEDKKQVVDIDGEPLRDSEGKLIWPRLAALEKKFTDHKPKEMDEVEARVVLDLVRSALQYDKDKRPSAAELLRHPWFSSWQFAFPSKNSLQIAKEPIYTRIRNWGPLVLEMICLLTVITGNLDTLYVRPWSAAACGTLRRSPNSLYHRPIPPSTAPKHQLDMTFYSAK